jgi:hypothetical protein
MLALARRHEVVPIDRTSRLAALRDEIARRQQALKELRQRMADPSGKPQGGRSTQAQIVAASAAVIADLIAERDRLMRET